MDDFSMLISTLTAGLRELPTDDATRIKHFLAEYLGQRDHPVPFGGRGKDFAHLDAWLADQQAPPYMLLAAPAGRGKSALLLRWCQRLLSHTDLAVVYFPVSIRFRTNLASVVFPALVALLAHLHGERLLADPHTPTEVWRSLLNEYITRPLPDGRSLVLILDGVDEAADWTAEADLFPLDPPPGVRVVVSARYLANDQDSGAWLTRLGWTRPDLASTLELYPLDRAGIASVLQQMGFPVERLSARVDIVAELHRLSEGDPLLIRLYVDDLWERGDAVLHLSPEDLQAIRPGLVGYFERWWNEQRSLWSTDAAQRETAIQSVLELLAGALGPLSQADILNLLPDKAGLTRANLARQLEPLARFVIGDGVHQGYVFSHPRLASYFLEERLNAQERQEVERRFLDWGAQTLRDLNAERLSPAQASVYIVQYYGAHLERAQAGASALLTLVCDNWRRAWERLDRAQAGFLSDSERAWRAAARENATAARAGQQLPYLSAEIRSLLCQASINSMASNISPRLMVEAVKTGIWTPARGLATLRLIDEPFSRASELVELALYVPEPLHTDVFQEALDTLATIPNEFTRLDALTELAPSFPEDFLAQILVSVSAVKDEVDRAGMLVDLVPALSAYPALIGQVLAIAQQVEDEEYRAQAFSGFAPILSEQEQEQILRKAQEMQNEGYRVQVFNALIPYVPLHLLQVMRQEASRIWDLLAQVSLLAELATHLPDPLRTETRDEALRLLRAEGQPAYFCEFFEKLAPILTEDQLHQMLQDVRLPRDARYSAQMLSELLPYIPTEQLAECLSVVQDIKSEARRAALTLQLFPLLPESLQEQALQIPRATWDEGQRVELLAGLAPMLPETLWPQLLELIQTIQDPGYQIWLLAELDASVAGEHPTTSDDLKQALKALGDEEERLRILLAIIARLSDEAREKILSFMLPEIFGFRWATRDTDRRAEILRKLAPYLPAAWLATALKMVRRLNDETYQVRVLLALAPRIDEQLLPDALEIVRTMREREKRALVLEALVSSLPEENRGERVHEMIQILQIIKDESVRAFLIATYASALVGKASPEQMQIILHNVATLNAEAHQAHVLIALAPHLPETMVYDMLRVVRKIGNEEDRGRTLDALAPHIPPRRLLAFVAVVKGLRSERYRAQILATLVTHASQESFTELLEMVQSIENEAERVNVLRALAPRTPEAAFAQFWSAIQQISDQKRRAWILGSLTVRVPEAFFPQVWQAIQEIEEEGWGLRTLEALAPHMSGSFFVNMWQAVQKLEYEPHRLRALGVLARYVPEQFFWEAFLTVQELSRTPPGYTSELKTEPLPGKQYLDVIVTLAERVPERFFAPCWKAVNTMQDRWRKWLQAILATRVPEACFSLVWQALLKTKDNWHQATLLEALALHVPDEFFPQYWETLQAPKFRTHQLAILKKLIPHLSPRYLEEIFIVLVRLPYPKGQVEMLEALLPYLSEEQSVRILKILLPPPQPLALPDELTATERNEGQLAQPTAATKAFWLRERQALHITELACRLPEQDFLEYLPMLLQAARLIRVDEDRVGVLAKLAPRVPEQALPDLLELLWGIESPEGREQVLSALLPTLDAEGWTGVFDLVRARVDKTGDIHALTQLLSAAGKLAQPPSPALLYPHLHALLRQFAQQTRQEAMSYLAPLDALVRMLGGDEAVGDVCCAALEVGNWWP